MTAASIVGGDDKMMTANNNRNQGRRPKKSLWKRITNTAPKNLKLKGGGGGGRSEGSPTGSAGPVSASKGGGSSSIGPADQRPSPSAASHDGGDGRFDKRVSQTPRPDAASPRPEQQQQQQPQQQLDRQQTPPPLFDAAFGGVSFDMIEPMPARYQRPDGKSKSMLETTLSMGGETKTCATATTTANTTLNTTISSTGSLVGNTGDGATVTTGGAASAASRRRQRLRELHIQGGGRPSSQEQKKIDGGGSSALQQSPKPQRQASPVVYAGANEAAALPAPEGSAPPSDGPAEASADPANEGSSADGGNAPASSTNSRAEALAAAGEAPAEDASPNRQQGKVQAQAAIRDAHPSNWWDPASGQQHGQQQEQLTVAQATEEYAEAQDSPPPSLDDEYNDIDDSGDVPVEGEDVGALFVEEVTRVVNVTPQQEQRHEQHRHPENGMNDATNDPIGGARLRSSIAKGSRNRFGVGKKMMKNKKISVVGGIGGGGTAATRKKRSKGGVSGINSPGDGVCVGGDGLGATEGGGAPFQVQDNFAKHDANEAKESSHSLPQGPREADRGENNNLRVGGTTSITRNTGNATSKKVTPPVDVAAPADFSQVDKDGPLKQQQHKQQGKNLYVLNDDDKNEHRSVNKRGNNAAAPHLYAEINIPKSRLPKRQSSTGSSTSSRGGDNVSLAMTSISSLSGRSSLFAGAAAAGGPHADRGFNIATNTLNNALWCHTGGLVDINVPDDARGNNPDNKHNHQEEDYFDYGVNAESYWNAEKRNENGIGNAATRGVVGVDDARVRNDNDDGIIGTLLGAWNEAFNTCQCFDIGGGGVGVASVGAHGSGRGGVDYGGKSVANTAATIMETVNDTTATIANMSKALSSSHNSKNAASAEVTSNISKRPAFSEPMEMI